MMICSECGTVNDDSAKFCKRCGNSLQQNQSIVKVNDNYKSNSSSQGNSKLLLACIALIACLAIFTFAFVSMSDGGGSTSGDNSYSGSGNMNSVSQDSSHEDDSTIYINHCDFYTGSSLSDKSYCSANIGTEHYGEKYKIGVLYSRDGSNLNDGATATKTVDEEGFLHIYTSNAFRYYPDKAIVEIYDADGNFLTEETYYLETASGQQSFD